MNQAVEQIIVRYLAGESQEDEIILLSEWLSLSDSNKQTFQRIKKYWEAEISGINIPYKEQSMPHLISRIRNDNKKSLISRPWFQYSNSAVAVILMGVCLYLYLFKTSYLPDEEQYYSYMSGNGVSSFSLPDGTQITLNKSSELTFSNFYNLKERKVKLSGEAYFNVIPNKNNPFKVELEGSSITVFGTVFNIRNKPEEKMIKTLLLEGSVRFDSPAQSVFLLPSQQLSYNKENEKIDIETVNTEIATSWVNSLIKYKSVTFPEFLLLLEEYYDVRFIVDKELYEDKKITGAFDANAQLERILNLIKKHIDFEWIKQDNQYIITRK
ncbi:MAG: FecR domain-containing protein [Prevotella sp.]|jgi:ferric-dicitrate binding protein FerR (iron transport regulator)|nr:FecR domain-containing protein [Prevotella sp.]